MEVSEYRVKTTFLFCSPNAALLHFIRAKTKLLLELTEVDIELTIIVFNTSPLAVGVCCSPTELLLNHVVYVVVNSSLVLLACSIAEHEWQK